MSDDSLTRLGQMWSAFGCARNPDDFKESVQDRMWEMALAFARESTERNNSLYRENKAMRDALAELEQIPATIAHTLKRALVWCGTEVADQRRDEAFEWVDARDRTDEMGG